MSYALIASIFINGAFFEYVIDYNLSHDDCRTMATEAALWPVFANGVEFTCEKELN